MTTAVHPRLPVWLRRSLPQPTTEETHDILGRYGLNTVCESALCPNRSECYSRSTATFMILGNTCTRRCGFCAIEAGKPETMMADEPERVALAAKELGLRYIVITSVARDDLPDEGAAHFAATIHALRRAIPEGQIEVLSPDFHARAECLQTVVAAGPEVFNHNVETVARLQRLVRPQADYNRSLKVLVTIKTLDAGITTKSGIMLGLGETEDEILETAADLRGVGCDILTLGQYLAPSREHLPVRAFKSPEAFETLAQKIRPMGFRHVFAGPYVRSSYHAGEIFHHAQHKEE